MGDILWGALDFVTLGVLEKKSTKKDKKKDNTKNFTEVNSSSPVPN